MNKKRNRNFGDNGFEGWGGYMAAKKAKLHDQFNAGATKEGIFQGVSIHVNGYTDPTCEELKRIMMDHGGTYHHYYSTEKTTHIVATNLPDVKVKQLKSLHVKVVKPEWITASLKAGALLDYRDYLLYTHQSTSQPSLNFRVSASTSHPQDVHNQAHPREVPSPQEDCKSDKSNVMPDKTKAPSSRPARTAAEPNFLSEFYSNSRLHHISTMGATFKQYVSKLRQENQIEFPGRARLKEWIATDPPVSKNNDDLNFSIEETLDQQGGSYNKVIMHIDMDCFFVSVGIRDRVDLKGVPVAVTHSKGGDARRATEGADIAFERNYYKQKREAKIKSKTGQEGEIAIESRIDDLTGHDSLSEIASCSYEARRAGVKNGMFMGTAIKLCPDLKTIPYDFQGYKEVAGTLYDTVASYTLDIEAVSCDEMFVDCTSLLRETGSTPLQFASCLRAEIKEKTRCPASAGFGSNRLLARLATKKAKPDGQYFLQDNDVSNYMRTIQVGDLPGVGYSMVHRLRALGIGTCEQLQKLSMEQLRLEGFGTKTTEALYNHCRGKDDRPLAFGQERKSVSAEMNYGIRFKDNVEAEEFLQRLSVEVHKRLDGDGARSITLKLMVRAKDAPTETAKFMGHGVCDNLTRSSSLTRAVRTVDAIQNEVLRLYKSVSCQASDLRGIGIQLARLVKGSSCDMGALDAFITKGKPSAVLTPVTPNKNREISCSTPEKAKTPTKSKTPESARKSPAAKASPARRKKTLGPGRIPESKTIKDFMKPRKKSPQKLDRDKFNLDFDVLAELPEDIRHEILEEYSKNVAICSNGRPSTSPKETSPAATLPTPLHKEPASLLEVSFSQVDQDYLKGLPEDVRSELESELRAESRRRKEEKEQKLALIATLPPDSRTETKDKKDQVANVPKVKQRESLRDIVSAADLKSLVRSWIESTDCPLSCDIEMVSEFLQQLIASREIDCIASIMRGIHRNISKRRTSDWQEAYSEIAANVQTSMLAVYNARLDINHV